MAVRGCVLAAAIADDAGLPPDEPGCQAPAHFALDAVFLVRGRQAPEEALDRIFDLFGKGWSGGTADRP